ncbi:MAG: DUF362 domain-containing protein [Candidatus Latescibacter sp.]|nr:DUF362 domain-containing protein [Candidatus Latescibacter sp.]
MKRRDFIKASAVLGMAGAAGHGCSSLGRGSSEPKFNVHPFIRQHPEAVFVHFTSVSEKTDAAGLRQAGYRLSRELVVRSPDGWSASAIVNIKPNWTSAGPRNGKAVVEKLGINTDPNFVEGWVAAVREIGPQRFFIRESCCPTQWEPMGWRAMCTRAGIDLTEISTIDVWKLQEGKDVIFRKVHNGVVFNTVAYQGPMNAPGSFLVNIAKLKAHGMGITASVKNLQGITCRRFHQFCTPHTAVLKSYEPPYHKYFQKDFVSRIEKLHAQHVRDGIPRWDCIIGEDTGIRMEQWAQRTLDSVGCIPTALNMVEGIYSQDGNGFGLGPHEPIGPDKVTSRDYMSNVVIFGKEMFRVDIIAHWLAGHEPGNFGLFHLARERGMSDVLDPHDIPLYGWKDGKATPIKLESLTRTPLVTLYLRGRNEPEYHLCNEPFSYSAFRNVKKQNALSPSIRYIGTDRTGQAVFDLTLPERGEIAVDILDLRGRAAERLLSGQLNTGSHQVVWNAFADPGVYTARLRGRGWETVERLIVSG